MTRVKPDARLHVHGHPLKDIARDPHQLWLDLAGVSYRDRLTEVEREVATHPELRR